MRDCIFAVALMLCGSVASAIEMPELARKKNCAACHAIERKSIGPAWLEVAKRYKGNNDAHVFLANKIKMGGFGIWGTLPMPAQRVSNEEADTLIRFILELSRDPSVVVSGR